MFRISANSCWTAWDSNRPKQITSKHVARHWFHEGFHAIWFILHWTFNSSRLELLFHRNTTVPPNVCLSSIRGMMSYLKWSSDLFKRLKKYTLFVKQTIITHLSHGQHCWTLQGWIEKVAERSSASATFPGVSDPGPPLHPVASSAGPYIATISCNGIGQPFSARVPWHPGALAKCQKMSSNCPEMINKPQVVQACLFCYTHGFLLHRIITLGTVHTSYQLPNNWCHHRLVMRTLRIWGSPCLSLPCPSLSALGSH